MTTIASRALALTFAALTLAAPGVAKDKKPADPNKKVCRAEVPTGSRMAKTTCHLPAEWAQIDADNAASAQSLNDRSGRTGTVQ